MPTEKCTVLIQGKPVLNPAELGMAFLRQGLRLEGEVMTHADQAYVPYAGGVEIRLSDGPVPDADKLRNRSNLTWRGVKGFDHDAHATVTWTGGPEDPKERTVLMARVVYAVLSAVPAAIGALTGVSEVLVDRETWFTVVLASNGEVPVPLWVRLETDRLPDGRASTHTVGLTTFGQQDLHIIDGDLPTAVSRTQDFIKRAVAGERIADGDPAGPPAGEGVRFRAAPSPDSSGGLVLRAELATKATRPNQLLWIAAAVTALLGLFLLLSTQIR